MLKKRFFQVIINMDKWLKVPIIVSTQKNIKRKLYDQALASLYMACTETKIYIQQVESTGTLNRQTEEDLARLWSKAAVPLRHINQDLANRCAHKSDYWLNPAKWSRADIAEYRIGITQVADEARKLATKKA